MFALPFSLHKTHPLPGGLALVILAALAALVAFPGCTPAASYQKMLQSEVPLDRAQGCKLAGESHDQAAIPLLIDRLEDPDKAVRIYADIALRQITGKDFGYRESDTPANRAAAVRRWRDYANSLGRPGKGGPGGGGGK